MTALTQEVRLHDGAVVRRRRARHLRQLPHQVPRGPARPRLQVQGLFYNEL